MMRRVTGRRVGFRKRTTFVVALRRMTEAVMLAELFEAIDEGGADAGAQIKRTNGSGCVVPYAPYFSARLDFDLASCGRDGAGTRFVL